VAFFGWEQFAPSRVSRLLRLDHAAAILARADLPGALLLAAVLGCVVVLFSTADSSKQVVASSAPVVGPVAVALIGLFYWRQRRAHVPLIEPGALIGAVVGGAVCRGRSRAPVVAAGGMVLATGAFMGMASWSATALGGSPRWSDVELVVCGLGFGLAIAPVNVAILGAVQPRMHALASALAVVARTIGMLAGLSALTAIGLHRFYAAQARIGSPLALCPTHPGSCPAYDSATTKALLSELHTIFGGAALCAAAAGVLAVLLLRSRAVSADVEDTTTSSALPRLLG
jgi:hypothetical protein